MKKLFNALFLILVLTVSTNVIAQTVPAGKTRADGSFTQIDHYLNVIKRLGIPTASGDLLEATTASANTAKIIWNTNLNKLRVYDGVQWRDAITNDLANYYTKAQVDSLRTIIDASIALKANDNQVVKLTGNQSISGVKTFTSANNTFNGQTTFTNGGQVLISTGGNRHLRLNTPGLNNWDISNANGISYSTPNALAFVNNEVELFKILPSGTANYISDISSSYTSRSLIDKGYADNTYQSLLGYTAANDTSVIKKDNQVGGYDWGNNNYGYPLDARFKFTADTINLTYTIGYGAAPEGEFINPNLTFDVNENLIRANGSNIQAKNSNTSFTLIRPNGVIDLRSNSPLIGFTNNNGASSALLLPSNYTNSNDIRSLFIPKRNGSLNDTLALKSEVPKVFTYTTTVQDNDYILPHGLGYTPTMLTVFGIGDANVFDWDGAYHGGILAYIEGSNIRITNPESLEWPVGAKFTITVK